MDSFLDIAPVNDFVEINGKQIPIFGISAKNFANLFLRFPGLMALFNKDENKKKAELTPDMVLNTVPEGVSAIIAVGVGHGGSKQAEEIAEQLPIATQVEILGKIINLTLPKGVGPFVEECERIAETMDGKISQQMSHSTNSQEQSTTSPQ